MDRPAIPRALGELDDLTRRLRRECPWDREQDERSIVPHTLEEAYELADAVHQGDDPKLLDELGDVLFQVHFLALLMEERGAGDLAAVAEHCARKLIHRHPHVFGELEVAGAADVLANWDRIKQGEEGREGGMFGELPENLPALLYARKVQRRAASRGFDPAAGGPPFDAARSALDGLERASGRAARPEADAAPPAAREATFEALGELLFESVQIARKLRADPELALRSAAERHRRAVESAAARAAASGDAWEDLGGEDQLRLYRAAQETPTQ